MHVETDVYLCKVEQLDLLKKKLRPGELYRRADLQQWSKSVDRHLQELVKDGTVEKLSGGLYYVPEQGTFGKVPAEEHALIEAFLKDNHFLVTSPGDYNGLGVGTTQLRGAPGPSNWCASMDISINLKSIKYENHVWNINYDHSLLF